jgi:D-glycero-D-manno-heptose 1,7-bisphosphate phosphatase
MKSSVSQPSQQKHFGPEAPGNPIRHPWLHCPPKSRLTSQTPRNLNGRAVFLDRDGTLVEDVGYLTDPSQLKLLPGSIEGLQLLQDHFLIVVVTNQSAIARGLLDADGLLRIHQKLIVFLQHHSVSLDAIYVCPHHPEEGVSPYRVKCYCRKPQPGMLIQAQADFQIRLNRSYLVGDQGCDILAGQRAGVAATVLIASNQNDATLTSEVVPAYETDDLYQAAHFILDHPPPQCR